ncbi:MAG TPA: 16S rRNA (adenine(1518)-N(6)/adenine(1519)-N(6))-dimethyltransferase RsmA, partial [Candidatus Saccharimonadales bacterium]
MIAGNDLAPRKSLGQHWLTDDDALHSIVDMAKVSSDDFVLEIGPGKGALTKLLTKEAKQVLAIELDAKLASYLESLNIANLTVKNEDILNFNLDSLSEYKLVANIPYYLTGKLIRKISEAKSRPSLAVLLVQKEIADRLSAEPGNLSVLGLTCQYFWQVEKGIMVTKDKFEPSPKVDSQVIRLTPKKLTLLLAQQSELFRLFKIGFSSKRKTILNNLAAGLRTDK